MCEKPTQQVRGPLRLSESRQPAPRAAVFNFRTFIEIKRHKRLEKIFLFFTRPAEKFSSSTFWFRSRRFFFYRFRANSRKLTHTTGEREIEKKEKIGRRVCLSSCEVWKNPFSFTSRICWEARNLRWVKSPGYVSSFFIILGKWSADCGLLSKGDFFFSVTVKILSYPLGGVVAKGKNTAVSRMKWGRF